jgi:hypothetical protein
MVVASQARHGITTMSGAFSIEASNVVKLRRGCEGALKASPPRFVYE